MRIIQLVSNRTIEKLDSKLSTLSSPLQLNCLFLTLHVIFHMETLSVIANIGGIVGLTDVAFKTTTNLSDLVATASSAPRTASQLLSAARNLAAALAEARIWALEHNASLFAHEDGRSTLKSVEDVLKTCTEQLGNLIKTLSDARRQRNTRFGQWVANLSFALSEAQLQHAIRMVTHHQNSLKMLMQVQGGHDMIVLRREIGYLKVDVHNVEHRLATASDMIQQVSTDISTSVQMMGCHRRNVNRDRMSQASINILHEAPPTAASRDFHYISQQRVQIPIRIEDENMKGRIQNQHKTSYIGSVQRSFESWGRSKMAPLTSTAQAFAAFDIQQLASGEEVISLSTFDPAGATLPLMLMEEHLREKIIDLTRRHSQYSCMYNTSREVTRKRSHYCADCVGKNGMWYLSCIRNLLKAAHIASADEYHCGSNSHSIIHAIAETLNSPGLHEWDELALGLTKKSFQHTITEQTSSGTLLVQYGHVGQEACEVNVFMFAFLANIQISTSYHGIFGAFGRTRTTQPFLHYNPRLYPHVYCGIAVQNNLMKVSYGIFDTDRESANVGELELLMVSAKSMATYTVHLRGYVSCSKVLNHQDKHHTRPHQHIRGTPSALIVALLRNIRKLLKTL
ncbi:hypothetical protein F5Y19DRAFT_214740 [Xylariaceae sp. FL1651]|nr:hypothetical protein F5Y19DRAFT_214740 [Xylariaceae sp. FL1651]